MLSRLIRVRSVIRPLVYAQTPQRFFSDAGAVQATEEADKQNSRTDVGFNNRVGADQEFNESKHSYVLTFPWNFEQVLDNYSKFKPMPESSYWHRWLNHSRSVLEFNTLFREFHQACAIPDYEGIQKVCEPRLAKYVSDSVERIHFHGLDVEMANLTVTQPSIRILKAEINQNLVVDRSQNLQNISDYDIIRHHNIFGANYNTYIDKNNDQRSLLDFLNIQSHRPFHVSLTCVIDSPMKLFVYNQNHSSVLFGSNDDERVKNIVRFEANLRWFDFLNLSPVDNKKSIAQWKITDFNNVLNENPLFNDADNVSDDE